MDYKTSMITDENPLRGLLFYYDLGFSHALHVLKKKDTEVSDQTGQMISRKITS